VITATQMLGRWSSTPSRRAPRRATSRDPRRHLGRDDECRDRRRRVPRQAVRRWTASPARRADELPPPDADASTPDVRRAMSNVAPTCRGARRPPCCGHRSGRTTSRSPGSAASPARRALSPPDRRAADGAQWGAPAACPPPPTSRALGRTIWHRNAGLIERATPVSPARHSGQPHRLDECDQG
jgi:hypothetical protein